MDRTTVSDIINKNIMVKPFILTDILYFWDISSPFDNNSKTSLCYMGPLDAYMEQIDTYEKVLPISSLEKYINLY
jgi:hypothetical protein